MHENEEIKARLPIEQVVGKYVTLKKAGRIYKACCPFHNEKTPSFTVSPDRGIFKCFGCGEGGDIFDFVMKLEGLTFPEALEMLADQAGVKLEKRQQSETPSTGTNKARLFQLNAYTAKLWHTILTKHPKAESARTYLAGRGLQDEIIERFEIGYAPLGQTTAISLKQQGFLPNEIGQAGDPSKFQDRITFPICDMTGKVVGFTGRLLEMPEDPRPNAGRGPKYWNTPETPLFNKSRTLYALHLAKRAIQDEDLSIIAEGQMDVIMLHQHGFANAVASSGTALTTDQVRLLGRFSTNIAFAYDQDKAGIEATKRGAELVLAAELNPFVIITPHGKDPADCLKTDPDSWQEAYASRLHAIEWLTSQLLTEKGELNPVRKKEVVGQLLPWLRLIKNEVEQSEWLRWIATRLQTDEKNLVTALNRSGGNASPENTEATPISAPPENQPANRAELAAALMVTFPSIVPAMKDQISSLSLAPKTPFLEKIIPFLEHPGENVSETLKASLSEDELKNVSIYIEGVLRPYQDVDTDEAWALEECMVITQRLRSEAKEQAKNDLASQIRLAQQEKDTQKLQELLTKLKDLL